MHRGTLGETDSETDDSTTHSFDHRTRSSIKNPFNRTSTNRPAKRPEGMPTPKTTSANRTTSTVRGAARRKMGYRQQQLKLLREIIKFQKNTGKKFAFSFQHFQLNFFPFRFTNSQSSF